MCREQRKDVKSAGCRHRLGAGAAEASAGCRGLDVPRVGTAPMLSGHSAACGWDRSGSPGWVAG